MAAGASSPELFSSIVALFVTHSALGLGTVVGSEIFNQLIICAGSVYASKTGKLILDKAILTREVGFYALSIALLYLALRDSRPLEADPDGPDYIYISFLDATMVFSGYILYVVVCSNFDAIVGWTLSAKKTVERTRASMFPKQKTYGTAVSKRVRHQNSVCSPIFHTYRRNSQKLNLFRTSIRVRWNTSWKRRTFPMNPLRIGTRSSISCQQSRRRVMTWAAIRFEADSVASVVPEGHPLPIPFDLLSFR